MNADKIILPDFLIADLYKDSLVDINDFTVGEQAQAKETVAAENKAAETSAEKIEYYGDNAKNIIVVVNQPNTTHLNKDDLSFLTNILKSCQLNAGDIAIINVA